jgi:nucleotide-binding universal stress UspA family protein
MKIDFKRILVPIDFSETSNYAIEKAARMADKFKAELYIIHVLESSPYKMVPSEESPGSKQKVVLQKNIMDRFEKITNRLTETYNISVNTLLGEEKVLEGIEDAIKDNNIDLVVMGTHGATGIREFLIGSNAQNIVNKSACPVMTFKMPPGEKGFKTIVMPIEKWNSSIEKLDYVTSIAEKYQSHIHLLGVMNSDKKPEMKKVLTLVESAEKYLKEAKIDCTRKVITSQHVAKETLQYAREIDADLILVMTEHESNLGNALPFVFARHIINHSEIPVMSIKPLMYQAVKISIPKEFQHNRKDHSNINK